MLSTRWQASLSAHKQTSPATLTSFTVDLQHRIARMVGTSQDRDEVKTVNSVYVSAECASVDTEFALANASWSYVIQRSSVFKKRVEVRGIATPSLGTLNNYRTSVLPPYKGNMSNTFHGGVCTVFLQTSLVWRCSEKRCCSVTSGFRREADEMSALLGYYSASNGYPLPTFRDNSSVPSSKVKNSIWELLDPWRWDRCVVAKRR
jgi:hypothetical protein